jgi:ABC-type phosphate/phosphonate transport system substrate-binding protein
VNSAADGVASLAMYPFVPLRGATDQLWAAVRRHLGRGPAHLEWTVVAPEVWRHPDLLVAQACGWPLVTQLQDTVEVVGTFDHDVPSGERGRYRSTLIGRDGRTFDQLRQDPATRAAVNGDDSLSGWVSLCATWAGRPNHVLETGAHLESVRAVADGRADLASIDAVSWALISTLEPELVAGLHVIGNGPLVPCLPIVVGWRHRDKLPALRAAFVAAVADPATADARVALRIRGFVPLGLADYLPLASLLG